MSADNYRECPQCKAEHNRKLSESYGKVSYSDYEELSSHIHPESLREDYEIYSEGDYIYVRYSCHCSKCGFKFEHEDSISLFDAPQ